jgi:hypothetical protein
MSGPSLQKAREWFESEFQEVHIYDPATHPPNVDPYDTPNGHRYFTVANGRLTFEGEPYPLPEKSEHDAADRWYEAVSYFWNFMGNPKFLWWRTPPEYSNGIIYSRLMMTHCGAYQSYRGKPAQKFKAIENG